METRLSEWNIEDELKTPEDRALFLEAVLEDAVRDRDVGFAVSAIGAVIRSIDNWAGKCGAVRRAIRTKRPARAVAGVRG